MKKILLLLLLIMPIMVNAKEISIKTNVSLIGKELTQSEFSFELKDKDGKVLQTKQNDLEGNVEFDPIEITEEKEYIYFIEEVDLKKPGYIYDNKKVYVKVNYTSGIEPLITYYKKDSLEESALNKV